MHSLINLRTVVRVLFVRSIVFADDFLMFLLAICRCRNRLFVMCTATLFSLWLLFLDLCIKIVSAFAPSCVLFCLVFFLRVEVQLLAFNPVFSYLLDDFLAKVFFYIG